MAVVAPESLSIDYDSNSYANQVYVQGATPTGSGLFTDHAAVAAANGVVRTKVIRAPECETASLAQALANMYLGRVGSGKARGKFTITSPHDGWRAGQMVTITDASLGLAAEVFRISRVTTRIAVPGSGLRRHYEVEFGGPRSSGGSGAEAGGLGTGQLVRVPFNFSGSGLLDSDEAFETFVSISERINVIAEAKAWVRFREFWAPARSATASSDLTSNSGGGSTTPSGGSGTTVSGGGSTTPSGGGSTSGSSSASSSNNASESFNLEVNGTHVHTNPEGGNTGSANGMNSPSLGTSVVVAAGGHNHGIAHTHTTPAHTHSTPNHAHDTPSHTHATPDHTHVTPAHGHALEYGMFKQTIPASWSVTLTVFRLDGSSWTSVGTVTGLTEETEEIDLGNIITTAGLWRLRFLSDAAQPNNGRVAIDIAGQILGAIASI